jgi:rRNA biogenesis protein RRP5
MRASRTLSSSAKQTDREISSFNEIKVGEILRGFVENITDVGLFVSLATNIIGRVLIRDLSDQFLKDWKDHFKLNQLVKAKVLSVDVEAKKVGLSLRTSAIEGKAAGQGLDNISKGDRIAGVVSRLADYGILIRLDSSKLTGLCYKYEAISAKTKLMEGIG